MESRWAPKRIEKFFGITPALVLDVSLPGVRARGVNHLASVFPSSCLRTVRGKLCRPYSFPVSEPVCSAEWKTLGFAIETSIERHRVELGAIMPTR